MIFKPIKNQTMKTVIIVLGIFLSITLKSQIIPYPDIQIFDWDKDTLCIGDTLKMRVTWNGKPGTTVFRRHKGDGNNTTIEEWIVNNSQILTLQKQVVALPPGTAAVYTVYVLPFVVPSHWPTGKNWMGTYWSPGFPIYVNDCRRPEITGIKEITEDPRPEPIYYDLNGYRTEKKYNQILIEWRGNDHRWVRFSE